MCKVGANPFLIMDVCLALDCEACHELFHMKNHYCCLMECGQHIGCNECEKRNRGIYSKEFKYYEEC